MGEGIFLPTLMGFPLFTYKELDRCGPHRRACFPGDPDPTLCGLSHWAGHSRA